MPDIFRWVEHPEIADYVFLNYDAKGSADLVVEVAEKWGTHLQPPSIRSYVRHRRRREELAARGIEETLPEPVAETPQPNARRPDQRQPMTTEQIEELFDGATAEIERKEATRLAQTHLTVNFSDAKEPLAVCFWSDWQVGANGVMMAQLKKDAETIRTTDGLQAFVIGDLIQNLNMVKHPESLAECVLPDPNDQIACARFILSIARPKIQGLVDGNHERNSKKSAGWVPSADWCKEFGFPYLWYGAKVNFIVGDVTYTIGIQHKFRGESGLNTTNVQRTMYSSWFPADVEVVGHRHYNDLQKKPMPGGDTVWLRSGSYQKWDDHGQYSGAFKGQWGIPVVVFYPDTKNVIPFYGADFAKALEFLADQRRRYREQQQRAA